MSDAQVMAVPRRGRSGSTAQVKEEPAWRAGDTERNTHPDLSGKCK